MCSTPDRCFITREAKSWELVQLKIDITTIWLKSVADYWKWTKLIRKSDLNFVHPQIRDYSNIEWKSSNNTYLNIIEIFTKLFKKIEHHRIANFYKNIDFGKITILSQKVEFLSQSKIRKNKSPTSAFHSYEVWGANYSNSC